MVIEANSTPDLEFLTNSNSGIGIELELPPFKSELESELRPTELDSELPCKELKCDTKSHIFISTVGLQLRGTMYKITLHDLHNYLNIVGK